jgi:Copper resistance protein K
MLKKMLIVVAMSAVSVLAVATETDARNEAKQVIELQDGSMIYVFKSGKMALEDKKGHAVSTKAGTVLKTKDGSNVTMVGNEVAELDVLLKKGQSGDSSAK